MFVTGAGVSAQTAGHIGIYSDPGWSSCELIDDTFTPVTLYVVHRAPAGATGIQFRLQRSPEFYCFPSSESSPFQFTIGDSETGIGFAYGQCLTGDILLLTITLTCHGVSAPCSYFEVLPDPAYGTGTIVAADCATPFANQSQVTGGRLYANPDDSCTCAVATRESSWGRIKALYR